MTRKYWLMKSETDSYSIDDLQRDGSTSWEGVRNYQARNFMRDDMRVGDPVLFYHSGNKPVPGVAGLARVSREAYPDPTALDPESHYHDAKASADDPRWFMVDIEFVERFAEIVPLSALYDVPGLEKMLVINKSRLSVQPVTPEEYEIVRRMGQR